MSVSVSQSGQRGATSARQKITAAVLFQLALTRGSIVSAQDSSLPSRCLRPPTVEDIVYVVDPLRAENPWSEVTRTSLRASCGGCHIAGRDSTTEGALFVFDLTEPVWYARMSPEQVVALTIKFAEEADVTLEQKKLVNQFAYCFIAGLCDE